MITATNLWKDYGETTVLERINLSVAEGEFADVGGSIRLR